MKPPVEIAGRKEIKEQVIQATLIALCTGLLNWGMETLKARVAAQKKDEDEAE